MNIGGKRLTPPSKYEMGSPVAYWLVPAAADRIRLQQTIDALASELDAPSFEPHITLYSTQLANAEDPGEHLASIAKRMGPMRLECGNTGHSGMLFQTLYIEFSYQTLAPLATALRDRCRQFASYQLEPHLSLLYRSLPSATREALAEQVNFAGKVIRFSSLAAVMPAQGETDFQNIPGWRVVARERLMGDITVSSASLSAPNYNDAPASL